MRYSVRLAGRSFDVEVDASGTVWIDGQPVHPRLAQWGGQPVYSLLVGDSTYIVLVEGEQGRYDVELRGESHAVQVEPQPPRLPASLARGVPEAIDRMAIRAPLAGRLVTLPIQAGQAVEAGQVVAVVESMKMQIELRAPRAGVVQAANGPPGRDVAQGEELLLLCFR